MENKELHGYGLRDRTKLEGIGGWLIIVASWNIVYFMINLSSYSNISQIKLAFILSSNSTIPEAYFDAASLGYMISLLFSIIMLFAFFKKLKAYKYLEIVNLASKTIFLLILCYTLGDINIVFTELTDLLPISILFSFGTIIYLFNSYRVKNTFIN